jgi:UDP-4-amino-4,6-dideoxy-N-acetyl-beta-L-altrosamine transaminase
MQHNAMAPLRDNGSSPVNLKRPFLPYGRQSIDDEDVAAVSAVLRSDYLTTGPVVEQFEDQFAKTIGGRFAIASSSGTSALHLALLALGLRTGDAAVVPSMTFLATANAVRMTGADVVFADVDPASGLLTAETLKSALARTVGKKVKAVLPVHLNGAQCEMEELEAVAVANDMVLVEDACHALGAPEIGNNRNSAIACFSTHPVKAITTGEGGVAITSNSALAESMRRFRNHGITRNGAAFRNHEMAFCGSQLNPWYYEMHDVGWNYRLSDFQCALGLSQLKKLARFWSRRKELARLYDQLLATLTPIVRPVMRGQRPHGWHLYVVRIDFDALGHSRASLMNKLRERGIGTQVHYIPVHRQPYFQDLYGNISLPGADNYYNCCLSLPLFPEMSEDDVRYVVASIAEL